MKLFRFNPELKLPRSFKLNRKAILIIVLVLLIPLALVGSFAGYKYFRAGQLLTECERVYSERNYIRATFVCEKSANYWFREHVKNKADKAMVLYNSHKDFLEGLDAYSNQQWQEAIDYLSKVNEDDPDYSDSIEKIVSANKELAAKEKSKKVAGVQTKQNDTSNVTNASLLSIVTKKTPPPKPDAKTTKKINALESKISKLEKTTTITPVAPLTLSLSSSQIGAIVQLVCVIDYVNDQNLAFSTGSGTIYHPNGYIFTNKHVVQNSNGTVTPTVCGVRVTNNISKPPDFKYFAILYAYSASRDVADLSIYDTFEGYSLPTSFNYLTVGSSSGLNVGDNIWLAGYPDIGGATFTLTKGIVSGRSGNYIKTDAEVSYGNSGGSALNKDKKYIGIPTAGAFLGLGTLAYIIGINQITSLVDWIYTY